MKQKMKILWFPLFIILFSYSFNVFGKSTLILASIGSDPSQKILTRQPFVNYLARHLEQEGIQKGKVVIVETLQQIVDLFLNNQADIFVDSPFPSIFVSHLANTRLSLRRWKNGVAQYRSVIFVKKESGIIKLDDLKGKMISFENPSSTSGYFLPKIALLNQGLKLSYKKERTAKVLTNEIGYTFSDGDETTMVWVLRDKISAGAIDYPNFNEDAKGKQDQLLILFKTPFVPRHIFSYRNGLSPVLVKKMEAVLLNMDRSEEGRKILVEYGKTKKFDKFPQRSIETLEDMKRYMNLELETQ